MTPDQRKAALALFQSMPPTTDREDLRKAIEAVDTHAAAQRRLVDTANALQRAQEVHEATGKRLEELAPGAAAGEAHVLALLEPEPEAS